ncbi:MAG: hypothetical protein CL912_07460 [Deltaproteobacteria bacterium]|nr:hypothetical protein [Deltaproteobacteria bacterium]
MNENHQRKRRRENTKPGTRNGTTNIYITQQATDTDLSASHAPPDLQAASIWGRRNILPENDRNLRL